jgi:putative alpha-1,2-mannosidase
MLERIIIVLVLLILALEKPKLTLGAGGVGFGCGSNSPAAQVPYSFVRLGPDTAPELKKEYAKFQHYGGYNDADHFLRAFSHMHLVGAGVIDMGIFGILPKKADKKPTIPGDIEVILYKDLEFAEPGYYKVDIEYNITA